MTYPQQDARPTDFVVPIVGLRDDGDHGPFLGTAVFVGDRPTLVTCAHVLDGWQGRYAIAIETEKRLATAHVLVREANLDLALLDVPDYRPSQALLPARDDEMNLNDFVMCFEYGTTVTAGANIEFAPANRLGNVTRFRNLQDRYRQAGDQMLELSFAALRGASGAPVMTWLPPFKLWGIVAANVSYELLPAHIEAILDEGGRSERRRDFTFLRAWLFT